MFPSSYAISFVTKLTYKLTAIYISHYQLRIVGESFWGRPFPCKRVTPCPDYHLTKRDPRTRIKCTTGTKYLDQPRSYTSAQRASERTRPIVHAWATQYIWRDNRGHDPRPTFGTTNADLFTFFFHPFWKSNLQVDPLTPCGSPTSKCPNHSFYILSKLK